jgi:homeobox-leucine zipper protein
MKLSQKMVNNFCASLSASQMHRWTALSGVNDEAVRVTVHRNSEPGQPNGVVLSAATSIWLPIPCERVFNFLKDERSQVRTSKYIVVPHVFYISTCLKF